MSDDDSTKEPVSKWLRLLWDRLTATDRFPIETKTERRTDWGIEPIVSVESADGELSGSEGDQTLYRPLKCVFSLLSTNNIPSIDSRMKPLVYSSQSISRRDKP